MATFSFNDVWVVIVAGGKGTRLFPYSSHNRPKQFCPLNESKTFIQGVIDNFLAAGIRNDHIIILVTTPEQYQLAIQQAGARGIISPFIYTIPSHLDYAGAMVKGTEIIYAEHDPEGIVICTPADQYIVPDDNFKETIENAVTSAREGLAVVVGAKVNNLITASGCGHAIYDPDDDSSCKKITEFVEKPDLETMEKILRAGNSACNTGINVWQTVTLLGKVCSSDIDHNGLKTDALMEKIGDPYLAIGKFPWYDCGTLGALYEITQKTPNHKNANLGTDRIERHECLNSLFLCDEGYRLHVTGVVNGAVVVSTIDGHPAVAIVRLASSQRVREFAEDYERNQKFLLRDFSFGARNNIIMRSNISNEAIIGFVDVEHYIVNIYKTREGTIDVYVAKQAITPLNFETGFATC